MPLCSGKDGCVLGQIRRPARYLGSEINAVQGPQKGDLRVGLAFPDHYEIGMSHLGMAILYHCLNRTTGVFAERVFLPDTDLEARLRAGSAPLTTLETRTPLHDLDVLGFSLAYELTYTNVLAILELGQIPLHTEERRRNHPLVLAGGPCAFNPEPLSPFVDAFVIGEAELLLPEICLLVREWKASDATREDFLRRLDRLDSVYVPSLFSPGANENPYLESLTGRTTPVQKAVVDNLDVAPFPEAPIVPFARIVHDRISIEAARGCPHGCRFCQASVLYRPVRERSPDRILQIAERSLLATGYEELSLLALSIGDYSRLVPLVRDLMARAQEQKVALSLPSLRVGSLDREVVCEIRKVRKTGFTLAPEAASPRLRDVVNKAIDEEELLKSARLLASLGWRALKLYFMIGLPTETEEDVDRIVALASRIRSEALRARPGGFQITINVSTFVPKAHTPFQWHRQISPEEAERRQGHLKRRIRRTGFRLKWHDAKVSFLEGVFARGDRRTAILLEQAYRLGCMRDGWTEHFRFDLWEKAFDKTGISTLTCLDPFPDTGAPLPWHWIDPGVSRSFLLREYEKALRSEAAPFHCGGDCSGCGHCSDRASPGPERPASAVCLSRTPQEHAPLRRGEPAAASGQDGLLRLRVRYAKEGNAVYLSHLETLTAIQRALRRSGLPIAYTCGETPHPRIALSPALPLGMESLSEYIDIWLERAVSAQAAESVLVETLPPGLRILSVQTVPGTAPSLEESILWVEYEVRFPGQGQTDPSVQEWLKGDLEDFLAGRSSIVEIRSEGKSTFVDLRPAVRELKLLKGPILSFRLQKIHGSLPSATRVLDALLSSEWTRRVGRNVLKTQTVFRQGKP